MQNFVFHNPVKIIFGRDTIAAIGPESAELGSTALLVYGMGSVKKNGVYDQVTASLRKAGITIVEHPGVQPNPRLSHVRTGIDMARKEGVELIIAVGGGSVIDTGKAISAGAVAAHDVWKFFTGKKSIRKTLPLITVPTLAAAGSEMNSGMVITNEETAEKFGTGNRLLYPRTSILDPQTTCSVPKNHTAYGAVDAIAHVLEFYMTTRDPHTPVQDRLMEGLIINAMDGCERCLAAPQDYDARADLMWTATLALNGLTAAGLGRVGFPMHMIEHSLSALYDVPHGAGLAVIIPAWLRWRRQVDPQRISALGRRIFDTGRGDPGDQADLVIRKLTNWFGKIDCPTTLAELDIPSSAIPAIAANALRLAGIWRLREYDNKTIETILYLSQGQ